MAHRLTPNYHDYLEIGYIYKGQGKLYVRNEPFDVSEGDIVLVSNDEMHRMEAAPGSKLYIMCIFFLSDLIFQPGANSPDLEYLSQFYKQSSTKREDRVYTDHNRVIIKIIEKMLKELDAKNEYYQLALKNYLLEILLTLLRHYGKRTKKNAGNFRKARDIERLRGLFSYIQNNYDQKISLLELSKMAYLSPAYLCRFFKKVTGTTISNYILRVRIDQAKELLIKSDLTITQIAFKIGFESHSYFDRVFHRFTKVSPKAFRQKHISKIKSRTKTKKSK